jgi:hypothetical protein
MLVIMIIWTLSLVYTVSDINECDEAIDDCAQVCTDTDLGYTCSCRSGYRLASNGHGCDGKLAHAWTELTGCCHEI